MQTTRTYRNTQIHKYICAYTCVSVYVGVLMCVCVCVCGCEGKVHMKILLNKFYQFLIIRFFLPKDIIGRYLFQDCLHLKIDRLMNAQIST